MTKNIGTLDRALRLLAVAAIALAYALGFISGSWAIGLGIVAIVLVGTSFIGTCPAYLPFRLSTRR